MTQVWSQIINAGGGGGGVSYIDESTVWCALGSNIGMDSFVKFDG